MQQFIFYAVYSIIWNCYGLMILNTLPHCCFVTRDSVHLVELVNRLGPDRTGLLTSKALPLVWHLLEIQSNPSLMGQLRQPTAELVECVSAQLDDDIFAYAGERLSSQACQLLDELTGNLQ